MQPNPELFDTDAIAHIIDLTGPEGMVSHSSSDPKQLRFLTSNARAHGYTPERYPALFRVLTTAEPQPRADIADDTEGSFSDGQFVSFVAPRPNGQAGSRATLTRTKPVATMTLTIQVVNQLSGNSSVVASGSRTVFNVQTVTVDTDDSTALPLPLTGRNSGLLSWAIMYVDGSQESLSANSFWAQNAAQDPTVTAPVQNPNRHTGDMNAIVIGLSRGFNSPANNTDVDYWFWQTQYDNITLLVPVQGSMTFKYPIVPLNDNNPILQFWLARTAGGMSELSLLNGKSLPYLPCFTIDSTDPKKLNFSLMATPNSAGTALNFGVSPWVSDTKTYFSCKVQVALNGPAGPVAGWSSILSADAQDTDPTDGITYIKPLVYVWHCLVAGTQITMADGSTKAIENLNSGDMVLSEGGQVRAVLATLAQPHWGTVFTVALSKGATLTGSGTHPVITGNGPLQLSALTVGTGVWTSTVLDTVASITPSTQSGEGLFNLWLDPGPAGATVFYANGILVGDYQMQVALLDQAQTDPQQIRARLPEELLRDFDSYVEDTLTPAKS